MVLPGSGRLSLRYHMNWARRRRVCRAVCGPGVRQPLSARQSPSSAAHDQTHHHDWDIQSVSAPSDHGAVVVYRCAGTGLLLLRAKATQLGALVRAPGIHYGALACRRCRGLERDRTRAASRWKGFSHEHNKLLKQ